MVENDEVLSAMNAFLLANHRPATLSELKNIFGMSQFGIAYHVRQLVADREVVHLGGARCYAPAWVLQSIENNASQRTSPEMLEKVRGSISGKAQS
jgi:hypothetical protein